VAAHPRRALLPLLGIAIVTTVLAGQTQNPPPAAGQAQPAPAATPRPVPPLIADLMAATRIADPAARLAALERYGTDYPGSSLLGSVDAQILSTLVNSFPDRLPAITEVFDRILGRIPADAAPDVRLNSTIAPVNVVVAKKLLLDRSSEVIAAAMTALTSDAYDASQRATAARLKAPAPTARQLTTGFNTARARGIDAQARIAAAKGDAAGAERLYRESLDIWPTFGAAATSLVDIYVGRKEFDKAEAVLKATIRAAGTSTALLGRPTMALADVYEKKGDDAKLKALLRDVLAKNLTAPDANVRLAKLEARRGNDNVALDLFIAAAAQSRMLAADDAAMRETYKKVHGTTAGLDARIDKMYAEKFPNPVKPEPYVAPAGRTDRVVLLELFTGSACGPCVAADLAFDAVMERYPAGTIVPVVYHQHIPGPDPMVTTGSESRKTYYAVRGVPTLNIDGALGRYGGGPRSNTAATYKDYISKIDKALLVPATAALTVSAAGEGDRIVVTADVTKLPADAKDLRLHLLLVEHRLRYTGENAIRFHPMVVRASAGDKGAGIPIAAIGRTQHSFSLSDIRDDITRSLAAEIDRWRRSVALAGSTPHEYPADAPAHVAIDTAELSVVAFIQQGAYQPSPGSGVAGGFEAVADAVTPPPIATPPAATAGPVANVLQSAMARVVFAAGPK
jgi:tetratricopeptide (TPR) repeat protein